jgi:hypothetical protein
VIQSALVGLKVHAHNFDGIVLEDDFVVRFVLDGNGFVLGKRRAD